MDRWEWLDHHRGAATVCGALPFRYEVWRDGKWWSRHRLYSAAVEEAWYSLANGFAVELRENGRTIAVPYSEPEDEPAGDCAEDDYCEESFP